MSRACLWCTPSTDRGEFIGGGIQTRRQRDDEESAELVEASRIVNEFLQHPVDTAKPGNHVASGQQARQLFRMTKPSIADSWGIDFSRRLPDDDFTVGIADSQLNWHRAD